MRLKEYLDSLEPGGHKIFARKLRVSPSFLSQMASGTASISPARCVEIELITEGTVTRRDLRIDWVSIWPELQVA
ncbi:prophage-related protein [Candidatus Regiella insecticola 5.15]|uniref:Prophage-related protein n=1 Tax=Candidatus Regiella insecticola 5.15 TaxID=1005043 RepID=G2H242_9ENTR|nr:YdaS family helix-turn-helix protein [Candidatus Regiella insecticola]EGY27937.1 prophage-related protein [Candidatus Regiella insecticola 5.15]